MSGKRLRLENEQIKRLVRVRRPKTAIENSNQLSTFRAVGDVQWYLDYIKRQRGFFFRMRSIRRCSDKRPPTAIGLSRRLLYPFKSPTGIWDLIEHRSAAIGVDRRRSKQRNKKKKKKDNAELRTDICICV